MSLRIRRLAVAAPLAEVVAVAMLTALLPALLASGRGTLVYQIMAAQRLALWVGPIGGFLVCALAGWWVARRARDAERNGLALGIIVAVLDLALLTLSGAPFGALMVLSAIGRIAGGYAGGRWAARRLSPLSVPLASQTP
jgi:hypothetical protein